MKKRILVLSLLLVFTALLTSCEVAASDADPTLGKFLDSLAKPAIIGIILSAVLEKAPFAKKYFDKITDKDVKRLVVLGFCVAVPLIGLAIGTAVDYYELTAETLFAALACGWNAFATATVTHTFIRDRK